MYQPMQRTSPTPSERMLLSRSPLRHGFLLVPFAIALAWLALSPVARADPFPLPDGGYPNDNTAEGDNALASFISGGNVSADGNTAIGRNALSFNSGNFNTATGLDALRLNTTGGRNTATGNGALDTNNDGNHNTATGFSALASNNDGNQNTATGSGALNSNNGNNNTATGFNALLLNKGGIQNTATGANALFSNTDGGDNTATGFDALRRLKTGNRNIALGETAGFNLTKGNRNIYIGNRGVDAESKTIRIGTMGNQNATFIAGIFGDTVVASGVAVVIDANGQLGTVISSARFKEAIKPMDKASEAILALKPVTFRYKHELDPEGIPQFGLAAEQVEKVNPDLVARDGHGKVNTVRYEAVNAMLLNEFLKEHRKVQELEAALVQQQKEINALTASAKVQASQIRKVSAQLEVSNATPQMVVNYQ